MSTDQNSDIKAAELEVSKAHQPAPGADEQKPTPPASDAEVKNPEEVTETPEQAEAKKESRRARSNARKAQALADARAEAKLYREERDRLNAKLEAQSKTSQETGEPKREDFPDYEAYLRAVTKYDARQEREAAAKTEREAQQGKEKQQQATAGQEKVAKAWAERETSFKAAAKDYEEVVQPFADDELQRLSHPARMAIVESDVGPGLLYQLAQLAEKNPDEFDRIADLSPVRQIAELVKLESKVSMPEKKTTSAPAPANTTTGGKTVSKDLAKMSQEEYEAHRKSQGARWAR